MHGFVTLFCTEYSAQSSIQMDIILNGA